MPASGPYVSPKEELKRKNAPRANVTMNHRTTATPAPKASHERAGWWRRGQDRNSSVTAIVIAIIASGQLTTLQMSLSVELPLEESISLPKATRAKANVPSAPAVTARRKAWPY